MKLHIYLTIAVVAVTVLAPAAVFAGGTAEAEPPADEPVSSDAPETSETVNAEEMDDSMRELLAEIGVRTFDEQIDAVDFGIPSLAGDETSLSDYSGEFVFLNFWATWCPPCREEMPSMEVMHQELSEFPFQVVAIDVQESPEVVSSFVEEMGYSFQILLDESGRVAANYGVRGIPTTYFISPRGTVLGMLVGTRYWDEPDILATMREIAEIAQTPRS
ncbi:MAG: TlpA disulfide reductase family protein [Alkalispirochaeta sp.]